jgi:CheY-like chemotaxis protein
MSEHVRFRGQIRYILVVDPDVNERLTLSMLLQRFGYAIASANNAREVIEFLCVAPAVAVFAESGEVGEDLLQRLNADARFREVPLVLITESPDRGLEERLRRGEIAGLVRKPFDADDIFMVIQKVIENGSRKNIRIATSLPAVLKDGSVVNRGYVTVLSQYGMFFRTLDQRPVNTRVAVDISLWDRTIRIEATVLYSVSFEDGPFLEPGMGMKIVKIGPEDSALIRAYILDQLGEGIIALDPGPGFRGGFA